MSFWEIVFTSLISVLATILVSIIAGRFSDRANQRTTQVQEKVAEQSTVSADLQAWTRQVADRLTAVEDDLATANERIRNLENELHRERNKFYAAVEFIRHLFYLMSRGGLDRPLPPELIREHL